MRTLPKPTTVIDIGKVKEDFTKGGRQIMIGINVVRNDFTGKEARVGVLQHFKAAFLAMRTQVEEYTVIHKCKGQRQIYKGDFQEHSNSYRDLDKLLSLVVLYASLKIDVQNSCR